MFVPYKKASDDKNQCWKFKKQVMKVSEIVTRKGALIFSHNNIREPED